MPCSYAFYTEGQQYCSTKMVMLVTHFKLIFFLKNDESTQKLAQFWAQIQILKEITIHQCML